MEFGGARYQSMMDRYIDGADVPSRELRRAWRDTVNIIVWDAPVYERFFSVVREVNQHLPKNRRIRVLLGDPALDWGQIQTKDQWEQVAAQRDKHAPEVIVKEVVQKRRKALLIYGVATRYTFQQYTGRKGQHSQPDRPARPDLLPESLCHLAANGRMGRSRTKLWSFCSLEAAGDRVGEGHMAGTMVLGGPRFEEVAEAFLYLGPLHMLKQICPA